MRVLVQHRSRYVYPAPAALGPHTLRLRPANHARADIEHYRLAITGADGAALDHRVLWTLDAHGNHVARVTFARSVRTPVLEVVVEVAARLTPVNPFDFFIDDRTRTVPLVYPDGLDGELAPFLRLDDPAYDVGPLATALFDELPRAGDAVDVVVACCQQLRARINYVIRDEAGTWTPEETVRHGRGSCRDSAVLLVAALRQRGLAARFVSGYLVQLADEGVLPDQPRGVDRDVVDLHAWAEVFLPGAGWLGLDATSGLLCGEGHLPLACTASPAAAAPLEGSSDVAASRVEFEALIGRLGHEPRPTAPYTDDVWATITTVGAHADALLAAAGLALTIGGEPTFRARDGGEAATWNSDALGGDKLTRGWQLAHELRARLAPGAAILERMGKHYPGEPVPRWALEIIGRADGTPLWHDGPSRPATPDDARALAAAVVGELGLAAAAPMPAFEDPWVLVATEAALPPGTNLDDSDARRHLARALDRGVGAPVAWVLPVARAGAGWSTETWQLRRERLFLLPGDSPAGLRLPLGSLAPSPMPAPWLDEPAAADPRVDPDPDDEAAQPRRAGAGAAAAGGGVRTALCVEHRGDALYVFVPPVGRFADFAALVGAVERAAAVVGVTPRLEGYPPPPSPEARRFAVTPDPGVLEVNRRPTACAADDVAELAAIYDAAIHAGLSAERHLLDGRLVGSGGGHHITLGGPTPLTSPLLARPAILASLLTFVQHHPALSYAFTGLFVGPTSQAPRVDEARHDALYELELALARLHAEPAPPPWMVDGLLRNLLVDVAGSTHRTEICIDKLFDSQTPYGRQGLVELRAFEMPPHPRLAATQILLVRALVAALAVAPYQAPLVRWGTQLHDRFLLPYWLGRDLDDVRAYLARAGLDLPAAALAPFVELRCPLVGTLGAGEVTLEVRNALEPWPVLGDEVTHGGTARFVDSSLERIELRARGLVPGRHVVVCGGAVVPMQVVADDAVAVGGVRLRAWCPPHALQPHLGIHHPLRIEVVDGWARRSLGGCTYHVWHPEGRAFDRAPLTSAEAAARREQRFTVDGGSPWPVAAVDVAPHPEQPHTLDLRRVWAGTAMPRPRDWAP